MSVSNKDKEFDLEELLDDLLNNLVHYNILQKLKRYELEWDNISEHPFGEYVKYDDISELIIELIKSNR